ncbi:MAG: hypothetical protein JJ964_06920 [Rhizobiales bacterium]|nr:hypothetical protein [Hyphomicrobiales bacterium]
MLAAVSGRKLKPHQEIGQLEVIAKKAVAGGQPEAVAQNDGFWWETEAASRKWASEAHQKM